MIRRSGARAGSFLSALVLLAVVMVVLPGSLVAVSRARFGGSAPWHGVPAPTDWRLDRIERALTDRLTEQTIADIVIRSSLIVVWIAVAVLVLTVLAELAHMIRHHGLAMPDIRGFGVPQSIARLIAAGLLVVLPSFASPARAVARDGVQLVPRQPVAALEHVDVHHFDALGSASNLPAESRGDQPGSYVVRAGDSIFGIAERLAGPDPMSVASYAEHLLDLNLGTRMPDGRTFTNAAFIDAGWVLQLPSAELDEERSGVDRTHVVERGESLWSIADDELGDGARWPEIFDRNEGRTFEDGRRLVEPDLIQPGWSLDLPTSDLGETELAVDGEAEADGAQAGAGEDVVDGEVATPPVDVDGQQPPSRRDNVWERRSSDEVADTVPALAISDQVAGVGAPIGDDVVAPIESGADAEVAEDVPALAASPQSGSDLGSDERSTVVARPESEAPELLTVTRATMLSAGALTLLGVRRRNQLRRARPRSRLPAPSASVAATERVLRSNDGNGRLDLICSAIGAIAADLVFQRERVVAVLVRPDEDIEFRFSGAVHLPTPWEGDAEVWRLSGPLPNVSVATRSTTTFPCPTLIQLGCDGDGRDVYVDLEACGAIEVGGRPDQAESIVAAAAMTLSSSSLAEVTTLIGLGLPDAAFLGHRLHVSAHDADHAFRVASEAIGTTATSGSSTFALRAGAVAGEVWEPAVVFAGSAVGALALPERRTGLAVISASAIDGPAYRLEPDREAWVLRQLEIRLTPIGVSAGDVASIAELVDVAAAAPLLVMPFQPGPETFGDASAGGSLSVAPAESAHQDVSGISDIPATVMRPADMDAWEVVTSVWRPSSAPEWKLQVRLIGPVEVVSESGETVAFERSKTRELVAWLATHRSRSTRTAARTALWELDVRDATFSNVVSEARRALARLVEPPEGEEWVGRTMTEALPLHELVVTDADLIERALEAARVQPPAQAIATLAPAVELINGMPFEGTSYLWPDAEGITSNLVLLATSAAAELAAHCLSIGDVDAVFRATGRGLRVLPGHEELIGLRMRAHAGAGDHAGVRQEWESYERVITSDPWSDGEPASKLVELRRRLLNPSR